MYRYTCADCHLIRRASSIMRQRCRKCYNVIMAGSGNRPNRKKHRVNTKRKSESTPPKVKAVKAKRGTSEFH